MSRRWTPDIAVIGSSLGGVLAAWRASQRGHRVLFVCENAWIGGQMTAQAVPPDEHALIEHGGASASYLAFREDIRSLYRGLPGFLDRARMTPGTNPGDGWVSRLCFEPVHAARWFEQLLRGPQRSGNLTVLRLARPVAVVRRGSVIESVTVKRQQDGQCDTILAPVFVDATDTGDLIHLANLPYRIGKEARHEFGEPDAVLQADPMDQQPITHVMALRRHHHPGPIGPEPEDYARWRRHTVPGHRHALLSPHLPGRRPGTTHTLPMLAGDESDALDWWRYRRIVSARQWSDSRADVTLVNWAQNDYAVDPLIDGPQRRSLVEQKARQLSLCLLHWLQTEAPRPEGGNGFPEWQLAPELLGTPDGLAARPYVRESRRIVACRTLTQNDLCDPPGHDETAVAIGWYPLDVHPTCRSGHGVNAAVEPFSLPLGSFIAQHVDNLIPASKNLGVTHLANACTRVHPIEWVIGEVAGVLAAEVLNGRTAPQGLLERAPLRHAVQERLQTLGIPARWPQQLLRLRQSPQVAA